MKRLLSLFAMSPKAEPSPEAGAPPMPSVRDASLRRSVEKLQATLEAAETAPTQIKPEKVPSLLRKPPANDNQPDFFVPSLWDIAIKDGIGLMDVAVFRLARNKRRKGEMIEHKLRNLTIQVKSNYDGMATIEDYSIIMMMISHLTEANRLYQAGKGPKPSRYFQPAASEILKFCRKGDGGGQYERLRGSIDRLQGTHICIHSETDRKSTGWFPLLGGAKIISETDKKRIQVVQLVVPDWIYDQIVTAEKPEVLTIHPDYFLISSPLARFIYRLARKAAGSGSAVYSFASLHARSGSTRTKAGFDYDLRHLAAVNDLPEYDLRIESGREGPMLRMSARRLH